MSEKIRTERVVVETIDGVPLAVTLHVPADADSAPVLVCFPAMGVKSQFYEPFATQLAAHGVIVARAAWRGTENGGPKPSRDVQFGYHDLIWYDYAAVIDELRNRFRQHPVYVLGHSLGGQLALLYASMNADSLAGVIIVAAGSVHYKQYAYPQRLRVLLGTQLAWGISAVLGSFPGQHLGFGRHESYGVIRDWAHQARTGRYELLNCDHDFENLLSAVELKVLAISIEGDDLAPKRAVDHLCGKLRSSSVTRWHYEPDPSNAAKLDHFRWAKRSDEITARIVQWLGVSTSAPTKGKQAAGVIEAQESARDPSLKETYGS